MGRNPPPPAAVGEPHSDSKSVLVGSGRVLCKSAFSMPSSCMYVVVW